MIPEHTIAGSKDAAAVVFIHGFPFNRTMWAPQMEALAASHRVIALDLRGQGQTPRGLAPQMIEFLVDDVIELLDALGIERATICGLSMGGYVALRLIDRHPERVHGLVLADTRAAADDNAGRVKRAGAIRGIRADGMQAFAAKMLPALFGEAKVARDASGVGTIREQMETTDPEGACDALGAMACRLDLTERLPHIETPTLIVVGKDDTITPPADSRAMHEAIPGSKLVELDDAGHVSNLCQPEAFTAALDAFLEALPA